MLIPFFLVWFHQSDHLSIRFQFDLSLIQHHFIKRASPSVWWFLLKYIQINTGSNTPAKPVQISISDLNQQECVLVGTPVSGSPVSSRSHGGAGSFRPDLSNWPTKRITYSPLIFDYLNKKKKKKAWGPSRYRNSVFSILQSQAWFSKIVLNIARIFMLKGFI